MTIGYAVAVIVIGAVLYCASVGVRTIQDDARHSRGEYRQTGAGNGDPERRTGWPLKIVRLIPGFQRRREADDQTGGNQHDGYERMVGESTRAIGLLTGGLVFVGIVSAVISGLTLLVIKGQLDEMRSGSGQTDKLIDANAKLADTASKNLIATQRAWLGTSDASIIKSGPMTPIKGMVLYANSGKEPAQFQANALEFVYSRNQWDAGVAGDEIVKRQNECAAIQSIVGFRYAWPVQGFSQPVIHFPDVQIPQMGGAAWTPEIESGASIVAVQGCLIYKAFGEIHHTAFCYFYDAKISDPAHLNICQVGNFVN